MTRSPQCILEAMHRIGLESPSEQNQKESAARIKQATLVCADMKSAAEYQAAKIIEEFRKRESAT